MASTLRRLSFTALRYAHTSPLRQKSYELRKFSRPLHQAALHRARRKDEDDEKIPEDAERQPFEFRLEDLSPDERKAYEELSPDDQGLWREAAAEEHEAMGSAEYKSEMNAQVSLAANEALEAMPLMAPAPKLKPNELGFIAEAEDEEDVQDLGKDPEFEGDEITSLAHGQLEQHRELREYARIAVWEMPLLYKYAKPFEPPSIDRPLRFRLTTYLGESHPAAKKVVCQFSTKDIAAAAKLTEQQRIKLIKLVGVRYNPDNDIVKMSSEMHDTPAQNKRYLSDLVTKLVQEARDGKDKFEDVPLDFRHHRPKKTWSFPQDWKLDAAKRQELAVKRERLKLAEQQKEGSEQLIEGSQVLRTALREIPAAPQRVMTEPARRRIR